jgi:hypothetical protein
VYGRFQVKLPPGWTVAVSRNDPEVDLGTTHPGAMALEARSSRGGHLQIWFACPETGGVVDYDWTLTPDDSGRGVKAVVEKALLPFKSKQECLAWSRTNDPPLEDYCDFVGDGQTMIAASFAGKTPFAGRAVCIFLSGAQPETAPRDELRAIAMSFRVVGEVGMPEPKLPGLIELRYGK